MSVFVKSIKSTTVFLIVLLFLVNIKLYGKSTNPIKVACIGNSITFGAFIKDRIKDSYPAQLGQMLGDKYRVKNYGFSGRTLLNRGNHPYMSEKMFFEAIKWQPDIVIITLGTNDSKAQNWKYKKDFKKNYNRMITAFDTLSSHPKIYLATTVPVYKKGMKINAEVVANEINPLIKEIAKEKKLSLIDFYTPFLDKGKMFPDYIHPNAEGAGEMAKVVYRYLTGKEGKRVAQQYPGSKTEWKGFTRFQFEFEGRDAQITVPEKSLPGKPWIWRARFPKWHTEMDSMLLSEGFHVVFVNTNNMYGSPQAMKVWDRFYNYLVKMHGFNAKVSLEGVSRGGLYIYNWAKENPQKINSIYAEAPVCDFKSWPAGFGNGKGSRADWEKLKKEYGFGSDKEAKNYKNNPIDNLDKLAKAKIPVLHMIGLEDQIVPVAENSLILINRYIKLGGIVKVVPCTREKQKLWGHHFTIETPRLGADFIKYYTQLPTTKLQSSSYHNLRSGLKNSVTQFTKAKKGRVAFLGGSITYNSGWRDSLCNYLQNRFPETEFDFIASGIPSMGSTCDVFRLERDILMHGPVDLLFVEAAVNDGGKGRSNEEQIRSMEGIVRHIRNNNPATDIVFMYFVDPAKIKDYRVGQVPQVIQNHDKVAKYYNIPAINLAKEVTERIDAGEFTWKDDFKNLHPSPFGQGIYAHSMLSFLKNAWSGFVAEDDKITDYPMPVKLDKSCYDNGILVEAKEVKTVKGWEFIKKWIPKDKAWTRANYTKVPMLKGKYPCKTLKFRFRGNAVGLAVAAGPDAGIIEYRIDRGKWQKQDLFTKHSTRYHLPWYFTLADGLKSGKHTLRLRMANETNSKSIGKICRIRYFYVNQTK